MTYPSIDVSPISTPWTYARRVPSPVRYPVLAGADTWGQAPTPQESTPGQPIPSAPLWREPTVTNIESSLSCPYPHVAGASAAGSSGSPFRPGTGGSAFGVSGPPYPPVSTISTFWNVGGGAAAPPLPTQHERRAARVEEVVQARGSCAMAAARPRYCFDVVQQAEKLPETKRLRDAVAKAARYQSGTWGVVLADVEGSLVLTAKGLRCYVDVYKDGVYTKSKLTKPCEEFFANVRQTQTFSQDLGQALRGLLSCEALPLKKF